VRETVAPDAAGAAAIAAERMAAAIDAARAERGVAHVALAGGNTPRAAYEALAALVEDWGGVHLWFGDERCVDPDDAESNYRMVRESLLARAAIPGEQVHRVAGELGAEAAAERYEGELRAVIGPSDPQAGIPALDLALQGLGEDGHTASLFPGAATLDVREALCLAVHGSPKPPPDRVTMSLGLLGAARALVVLASGAGKAGAVRGIQAGPARAVPASLLPADRTELVVDQAAAGR